MKIQCPPYTVYMLRPPLTLIGKSMDGQIVRHFLEKNPILQYNCNMYSYDNNYQAVKKL